MSVEWFLNHLCGDELIQIIKIVKEHKHFQEKTVQNLPIKGTMLSY